MNDLQVALVKFIRTGLVILQGRFLILISLLMVFGLACEVMYDPNWIRASVAAGFAILVFLPLVSQLKEKRNAEDNDTQGT